MLGRLAVGCTLLFVAPAWAGESSPAPDELVQNLRDEDPFVRLRAAKELGQLGAKAESALAPLSDLAVKDPDEDVRLIASRAVDQIRAALKNQNKGQADEQLLPLRRSLRSRRLAERLAAVKGLAALGQKAVPAVGDLIEHALISSSPDLRQAAADAIEEIVPFLHRPVVTIVFDSDSRKQAEAVEALRAMGAKAEPVLAAVKFHYVRTESVHSLAAIIAIKPDDPAAIRDVLTAVATPGGIPRRTRTIGGGVSRPDGITLLERVKLDNARKAEFLISALGDVSSSTRAQAVRSLAKLGGAAAPALPVLKRLKLDRVESVRDAAERAIGLIESVKEQKDGVPNR